MFYVLRKIISQEASRVMSVERKSSVVVALFSLDFVLLKKYLKYSDSQAAVLHILFKWLNSQITDINILTVFPCSSVLSFSEQKAFNSFGKCKAEVNFVSVSRHLRQAAQNPFVVRIVRLCQIHSLSCICLKFLLIAGGCVHSIDVPLNTHTPMSVAASA
jgi:hypothetical protein